MLRCNDKIILIHIIHKVLPIVTVQKTHHILTFTAEYQRYLTSIIYMSVNNALEHCNKPSNHHICKHIEAILVYLRTFI